MFNHQKSYSDSALSALGLQVRREPSEFILPALGVLSVGLLAGAGLGLLLAPRRGSELREDIGRGVHKTLHGVANGLRKVGQAAHLGRVGDHSEHDYGRSHAGSEYENSRDRFSSYEGPRAPVFSAGRTNEPNSSTDPAINR